MATLNMAKAAARILKVFILIGKIVAASGLLRKELDVENGGSTGW